MTTLKKKKICIVVLGDIGRSPRMQYHALSFINENYNVQFIGYSESQPIKPLLSNENLQYRHLYYCPNFKLYLPTLFAYVVKVFWQILTLFWAFLMVGFSDYVLVQNPPAIPALGVCYLYCKLSGSRLVVDWHNYANSILALSLGPNHSLVRLCKRFEFYLGKKADKNICVSKGMMENLKTSHGIKATTFYDCPPDFFKKTTVKEKHRLFLLLGIEYAVFLENCESSETIFTRVNESSEVVLRDDRPALLISSTSWTEDEDFSILLSALEKYEKAKEESNNLPKLICAITGKGPLKEFYINLIDRKNWKHIQVITPWLEPEHYPLFLGSADLGVCLHKSSSGLDLPMKVVDMFGCSVPVCAINFPCISELVKEGENGFIFNDDKELFTQIKNWFQGFPAGDLSLRTRFQENLKQSHRWHDNWKANVEPLFQD